MNIYQGKIQKQSGSLWRNFDPVFILELFNSGMVEGFRATANKNAF